MQSLKFESKLYASVKEKMEEMQQHNMSWIEVRWIAINSRTTNGHRSRFKKKLLVVRGKIYPLQRMGADS